MPSPLEDIGVVLPVLAAPMAGDPSTPTLVGAAARAGSLGFLAAGYKTAEALAANIAAVRLQAPVFGVNLFAPNPLPVDIADFQRYGHAIRAEADRYGIELAVAKPVEDDDQWRAKVDLLVADPVPVVSFTFGIPEPCRGHGIPRRRHARRTDRHIGRRGGRGGCVGCRGSRRSGRGGRRALRDPDAARTATEHWPCPNS